MQGFMTTDRTTEVQGRNTLWLEGLGWDACPPSMCGLGEATAPWPCYPGAQLHRAGGILWSPAGSRKGRRQSWSWG